MVESAKLPSGPQSLCFNKEDFMKEDFNVEHFVVECRRKVSLDSLRNDLHIYLKILQNAMIELINKDYADFVNLSTNLVGMDKAINNLIHPLSSMKQEILNVKNVIAETEKQVDEKIKYHRQIQERKDLVKLMMNMCESVEKMEQLLGVQSHSSDNTTHSRELSGQLVERVATEFNKLQFYVSKSRGMPMVEDLKPRIASITQMLQYNLEGSFREGLIQGKSEVLLECLRTYATIDKMRDAENLFRVTVVKQYMEEIINEQFIRNHPQGLAGMFDAVMDFFPKHYEKLQQVTTGSSSKSGASDRVGGYDFVVNAVFPEVVSNIEARTPSIFAPGNPNVFHEKYTISLRFLERFELQCGTQASVKRLRSHPSYNTFMNKWSLPVYFQIRFQEIAGTFESSLLMPFTECEDWREFRLEVSRVLWECLMRCWDDEVLISALCHRFWKLSLQLIARYSTWMGSVVIELDKQTTAATLTKSDSSSGLQQLAVKSQTSESSGVMHSSASSGAVTQSNESNNRQSEAVSVRNVALLVTDSQNLAQKPMTDEDGDRPASWTCKLYISILLGWKIKFDKFFDVTVFPCMSHVNTDTIKLLKESVEDSRLSLGQNVQRFNDYITTEICSQCTAHLKAVNDIPRLYRRTNREMPSKPSAYVSQLTKPISDLSSNIKELVSAENHRHWIITILQALTEQKMEESLKRLKAARSGGAGAGGGAGGGASDDDKIRHQILLDVQQFSKQMKSFGVSLSEVEAYGRLLDYVQTSISTAAATTTTT